MKKLLTILIMVLLLCACSGGNGGKQENVTKVNKVGVMEFVPEEGYTAVEYFSEQTKDGSIIEKDVVFTKESGATVGYAVMTNQILAEITDLSQFESFEVNGDTYYMYTSGSKKIALCQKGNDIYAVQLDLEESNELHTENEMQDLAATVTYTDSFDKTTVSTDLFGIEYAVDESLPLASTAITVDQDAKGNVTEKTIYWKYGQDTNNLDFRLAIFVYKNKTLDDVLYTDSTYLDENINGVDYKVLDNGGEHPYSYYTQHGNDVYQIRNAGVSSGWFGTTRSEESFTALDNLLNSISFK